jgi:alpha-L-arabinofuranosidase
MIKQHFIRLVLFSAAVFCFSQESVRAEVLPAVISVDETRPIKAADNRLLGFNYEWAGQIPVCGIPDKAGYDPDVVTTLQGLSLPLNRMSGTPANVIKWKEAVGPYAQRSAQKLVGWWPAPQKIGLGPVEWIQMVKAIDPSSRFTWTVNLFDPPQDTADLVEFLTGDGSNPNGGTNWAQMRIDGGIANPVAIEMWELGNELDGPGYRKQFQNITAYTDLCRPHIAAIRSVKPDAKIGAHVATFSSLAVYAEFFGGSWEIWHQSVLREIGPDIDYLAFHPYVNSLSSSRLEGDVATIAADIRSITGSDRIKIYISEHAWWPKTPECPPGTPQWRDCWFTTHALIGCLGTADWMTRMINSPAVELAAYHSFSGGPWGVIYKSAESELYTTGIVDLYKLLGDAFRDGVNIVPVSVSGPDTDRSNPKCLFSAAALTTTDGLNLILVNRDESVSRKVDLKFKGQYTPVEMTVLTAPDINSYNTATDRPISVERTQFAAGETTGSISVPAKSLVVLKVKTSVSH